MSHHAVILLVVGTVLSVARPGSAAPPSDPVAAPGADAREGPPARRIGFLPTPLAPGRLERPMGTAEVGLGWLVLPGAKLCLVEEPESCKTTDTSFSLEAWPSVRLPGQQWAVGAGVLLALVPTTSPEPRQTEEVAKRSHSRRYLTAEAMVRYYPLLQARWEGWVGGTAGLAIVGDSFTTTAETEPDRELVGPSGVGIRTEGWSFGGAFGGAWRWGPAFSVGACLRYGVWLLPGTPARSSLEDSASLEGPIPYFVSTISLGYRMSL